MPDQIIGLYIGKFQPFHNGHLFAIQTIVPNVSRLIIAIGSSQYHDLPSQPFSAQQRRRMIEQTLLRQGIKNFSIVEIPDIHDNEHWVDHVRDYVGRFDVLFTNNDLVARLFADKDFKVQSIKVLPGVSGTLIRQKMIDSTDDWPQLVPDDTYRIIANVC